MGIVGNARWIDQANTPQSGLRSARATNAKRAVVLGAGFIGMEVASVLAQQGLATTMVFPGTRIWERFFTPEMSAFFRRYYEAQKVAIMPRVRPGALPG